ncbi:MAG: peptidylprolyl isomerase [Gemmatimonadota bacterium]|nr:peptidylprolyl isomerase [Gemmatimonadota bacterium]
MREATKPIMLFTALAFAALMVFEWGMDASGMSSGSVGEIGSVNGDPVMYEEYMASYRRIYDQVQNSQEGMITSQQNRDIEDDAFEQVVTQVLIQQELAERGISVSDQEISEAAQFSPPEYLRPQFVNAEGQFDLQAYQSFLASLPPDQLLVLEGYYRDVIPRSKLLRQVTSGIYVSDADLWERWKDRNEQVSIRYVPLNPAERYPDEEFTVPEEDIEAYYRENEEDFEVPARATVKAAVLPNVPTPADTAASRERARELRQEILGGEDFAAVAERASADDASADNGGDLGVFGRGEMTPVFDSVAFSAPVGQVSEPVQTSFGFHLIEVTERWAQDSVQARHVLVPIERTDESEIEFLTLADSLEDMSEDRTLEEAAEAVGATVRTVEISEDFPFVQGAGQISEGADWVFEDALVGEVSPLFETQQAFYALELIDAQPAGVQPLEEVRSSIESTLRLELKLERARAEAEEILARVREGEALANAAADAGLDVRNAGPFTRLDFVPGIGRQNAAIGAAFGTPEGEVSNVVTTASNAYLIEVLERTPADSTAWREQVDQQRAQVTSQLQQQRLDAWIEALREAADVVDRRDEVLQQPGEEAPVQPQMPLGF